MAKTNGLCGVLLVLLILGVDGQRGGSWDGGSSNDEGCCYGLDANCGTTSKSLCDKLSARKGCEWRAGDDADCTFIPEPGCCYSSTGNSKCDTDDKALCTKMANRAGCQWLTGEGVDCTPPAPEPGCCYSSTGNAKCAVDDQPSCTKMASRAGCEWLSGEDADCTPPTPEPGCCYSSTGNTKCSVDNQLSCDKMANRAGCEWLSGEGADCTPPTPEPGCCFGADPSCDTESEAMCTKLAKRKGCQWRAGQDANCEIVTDPPTPSPIERPDAYICTECNDDGCCYMDPTKQYWYRCDRRSGEFIGSGWLSWDTAQSGCQSNSGYGCEWRAGPDDFGCAKAPDQADGCCVNVDPTKIAENQEDRCSIYDEFWGKDICTEHGADYGCEWRAGPDADCTPNTIEECFDQFSCNDGVRGYHISCDADSSCRNMRSDLAHPLFEADHGIDCNGFKSCDGSSLISATNIDCGGQWSCTGYGAQCSEDIQYNVIEAGNILYCGGYQSCAWSPKITAGTVICNGEESCAGNMNPIVGVAQIKCQGKGSCTGNFLVAPSIECTGLTSCDHAMLVGQRVSCTATSSCYNAFFGDSTHTAGDFGQPDSLDLVTVSGFQGAANAAFVGVAEIRGSGTESLAEARIASDGIASMVVVLSGALAGDGANAVCEEGSKCIFLCNGAACAGLEVGCVGTAICEFGAGLTTESMVEMDCYSNAGQEFDGVVCPTVYVVDTVPAEPTLSPELADSNTFENHIDCKNPERMAAEEKEAAAVVADATGFWQCDEQKECEGQEFDGGSEFPMEVSVTCAGVESCEYGLFTDIASADCNGRESCYYSQAVHGSFDCNARESCYRMQYGDSGDVHFECNGNGACKNMQKDVSWADGDWAQADRSGGTSDSNEGSQSFVCRGFSSCADATLLHVSECSGAKSCDYMIMDKTPGVECSGDNSCVLSWFYDNEGSISCDGDAACNNGRLFKSDNLYCDGRESCRSARIYGPNVLYARGEEAMSGAVINSCHSQGCDQNPSASLRDITIYALGRNAMTGAILRCYGGATCDLHCHGDACSDMMQFQCYDGATCNCDGPGCPEGLGSAQRLEFVEADGLGLAAPKPVANEPLVVVVGAGTIVLILSAIFYLYGGEDKEVEVEWE